MHCLPPFCSHKSKGSALMLILIILGLATALLVGALKSNPQIERDKITADALAKAKDALIGYAATYRDSHPNEVFGYLPCPDADNNGEADGCGGQDVSLIGRLPWKTLGLPPLRDSSGECLWYAVSGRYKNSPPTTILNWDTTGQFVIQDATSAVLANGAVAVVFAARSANAGQTRTSGTNECSGDNTNNVNAYLDGSDPIYAGTPPAANASSTLTMSTVASIASGTNNDHGLWITPNEIWDRVKKRSDFAADITNLLADIRDQAAMDASCTATTTLDSPVPGSIIEAGVSGKTVGMAPAIQQICIMTNASQRMAVFNNWRNNILYAACPGATACLTVNGSANCAGAVIFSGERLSGGTRPSSSASNYLENDNLSAFSSATTTVNGAAPYAWSASSQDIAVCIPPVGAGGGGGTIVKFSDPAQFSKFEIAGGGVTVDPVNQTATIDVAGGSSGGCLWFPDPLPLNGKILRSYYEFTFTYPDPPGGSDYGYGFPLSFLEGDMGKPTTCGSQSRMGVIPASTLPFSLFVETDISRESANGEPSGTSNHTAIMANGNVVHSASNGTLTTACNGTAAGCSYALSNKFEESPTTLPHNQRVEIHNGYNNTCTATGGTYSLVKAWVDCVACDDTATNFSSSPTVTRCINLDSSMNDIYFGFTAGFSSTGGQVQGATLGKLELRVE